MIRVFDAVGLEKIIGFGFFGLRRVEKKKFGWLDFWVSGLRVLRILFKGPGILFKGPGILFKGPGVRV